MLIFKAKIVKNKVAPPFRVAEFDMMHADGISYEGDLLDLAIARKLIVKSVFLFRYGDDQLGQGRERTRSFMKEHPELCDELKEKILAQIEAETSVVEPSVEEQDDSEEIFDDAPDSAENE